MVKNIIGEVPAVLGLIKDYITSTGQSRTVLRLIAALVLFLFGLCILNPIVKTVVSVIALLIVIYDIALSAFDDVMQRHFFSLPLCMTVGCVGAAFFGYAAPAAVAAIIYHCGIIAAELARFKAGDELRLSNEDRPESVTVLREGTAREMRTEDVRRGDIVTRPADSCCAFDGVVVEGESVVSQPEPYTDGEEVSVKAGDYVYAGAFNSDSTLHIQVAKTEAESAVVRLDEYGGSGLEVDDSGVLRAFLKIYLPAAAAAALIVALLIP